MGIFKIGAGYRRALAPKSRVNFVLSRSESDVVQIGTVGTANIPLMVKFDDFSYWGFEGGQRFFFSQVRFTPFVGYLVGLNRFGDIKGLFLDVPPA